MRTNTEQLINPLAYIHPDAKIGAGVRIDPFATIHGDVEIGEGSWIGSNVVIDNGARIGKNCRIFPGAVISTIPQDLKFEGEYTTCEIGDHSTIREYVTVNRGTNAAGKTVVGDHVLLMAYAHVAHDCILGDNVIIANAVNLAGHVEVEANARLGGMCAVHQFVRIGQHVMVQGGSLIMMDVPPFVKAGRRPLRYMGINSVGLKRGGFEAGTLSAIQDIYRLIYMSGLNNTAALNKVREEIPPHPIRDEILDWITNSDRGIIKGYGTADDY